MSDFDTENAAADFCHEKLYFESLFLFIKRSLLSAIVVANCSSDIEGERELHTIAMNYY
jgi:hypothetical protein